jgi:hypothetical protein
MNKVPFIVDPMINFSNIHTNFLNHNINMKLMRFDINEKSIGILN